MGPVNADNLISISFNLAAQKEESIHLGPLGGGLAHLEEGLELSLLSVLFEAWQRGGGSKSEMSYIIMIGRPGVGPARRQMLGTSANYDIINFRR